MDDCQFQASIRDFADSLHMNSRFNTKPCPLMQEVLDYLLKKYTTALLPGEDTYYRARVHDEFIHPWHAVPYPPEGIGAPPPARATQGRLNAAGIPFLYLSDSPETATLEVGAVTGQWVTIGVFTARRTLLFLDFSKMAAGNSGQYKRAILYLESMLAQPLKKGDDQREYIFGQWFAEHLRNHLSLDGVIYRSTVAGWSAEKTMAEYINNLPATAFDHLNVCAFYPDSFKLIEDSLEIHRVMKLQAVLAPREILCESEQGKWLFLESNMYSGDVGEVPAVEMELQV